MIVYQSLRSDNAIISQILLLLLTLIPIIYIFQRKKIDSITHNGIFNTTLNLIGEIFLAYTIFLSGLRKVKSCNFIYWGLYYSFVIIFFAYFVRLILFVYITTWNLENSKLRRQNQTKPTSSSSPASPSSSTTKTTTAVTKNTRVGRFAERLFNYLNKLTHNNLCEKEETEAASENYKNIINENILTLPSIYMDPVYSHFQRPLRISKRSRIKNIWYFLFLMVILIMVSFILVIFQYFPRNDSEDCTSNPEIVPLYLFYLLVLFIILPYFYLYLYRMKNTYGLKRDILLIFLFLIIRVFLFLNNILVKRNNPIVKIT